LGGVLAATKLAEVLIKQGVVKPDQVAKAMEETRKSGNTLSQTIVSLGLLKESQILKVLESIYQIPSIDLNHFSIKADTLKLISKDVAEKNCLIPVQKVGESTLVVAFSDPSNLAVRDDLRFLTRCKIQPVVALDSAILAAINRCYNTSVSSVSTEVEQLNQSDEDHSTSSELINLADVKMEDVPVVKFVNAILNEAIQKKASDIHFEPYEKKFRVRLRIDGVMSVAATQSMGLAASIASRLKIMAKLDIAEKRRPQDGRIKIKSGKSEMDFRVSVLPTIWGEKVVLRLLDKTNLQLDMTKLGFEPEDLVIFKEAINQPQGLLLISGPTGSGKTTTIYSALAELNRSETNISTVEDPVEINLEGINQVQMNSDIGLTFASALRSFLRQDPDVIMVGEIRDLETAEIAMKAASTGHLVVSTLHTNDAPQTITRLIDMGVAPYIVTSTVSLIVAQRLVGKICEQCKVPVTVEDKALIHLGVEPEDVRSYRLFKGKGCQSCNGTGIKGRIAIFELMKMSENIREAILEKASASVIRSLARKDGMRTLRRSALLKLKRGETTIEEVLNASVRDT
jgi:type IV pilus assembly protein PilB